MEPVWQHVKARDAVWHAGTGQHEICRAARFRPAIPEENRHPAAVFDPQPTTAADKTELYLHLETQFRGLLDGERDPLANAANLAAMLYHALPDVNWAGFYRLRGDELVLGPFQGKPACVRLPLGKGVCATAAERKETVIVPDVHDFPGHIACDLASRSEIVVPVIHAGRLLGVLDLDSPVPDRFDAADQAGLEHLAAMLVEGCDW